MTTTTKKLTSEQINGGKGGRKHENPEKARHQPLRTNVTYPRRYLNPEPLVAMMTNECFNFYTTGRPIYTPLYMNAPTLVQPDPGNTCPSHRRDTWPASTRYYRIMSSPEVYARYLPWSPPACWRQCTARLRDSWSPVWWRHRRGDAGKGDPATCDPESIRHHHSGCTKRSVSASRLHTGSSSLLQVHPG